MIEGTKIDVYSIHLNCRSLSSDFDVFHNLLCELHNNGLSFDIIEVREVVFADRDPNASFFLDITLL